MELEKGILDGQYNRLGEYSVMKTERRNFTKTMHGENTK